MSTNDMNLTGRIALVTGASSGIGKATAKALADAGVLVGLAARSTAKLEILAEDIEAGGGRAAVIPTDLRNEDQIASMVATTLQTFGSLDILVNNAGVFYWKSVADADADEWRRELEVNLLGLMNVTRIASNVMLKQGSGHIVNVSSLSGRYPGPGWPGYTASKFGVNGFTESILYDLRKNGIRVTLIEPGEVDTPMQSDEERESGRFLNPEDVADAIIYAISRPDHVIISDIQLLPNWNI
jgi:hypothetical protein